MELIKVAPKKALNKAFLKLKPIRSEIECFKANLIELIDKSDYTESEEFHKNLVAAFLNRTYYHPNYYINTKGRNDLVIYNGKHTTNKVGVIIETKKPTNKNEMISITNINVKAFHELILYYLRERITGKNLEIKHLIATNISEWFIFESSLFEKLFANDKNLVKQFVDFEEGRLSGKNTDFFYSEIAKPFVSSLKTEIVFTHFSLAEYEKALRNADKTDDNKLIALFKLFSPEHLLKLPFANDSNSLDKKFYSELLHIIGLAERKEGNKKIIDRKPEADRNYASILECTIDQLDSLDKISRLENPKQYGNNYQERLFSIALELSITWINRILFLKLLEAQLKKYHKGSDEYAFLNSKSIHNYDDLNTLFFQVLAKKHEDRNVKVRELFDKVPYLNSSLFEPTELEHSTIFISNLPDSDILPFHSATVLKDNVGKKLNKEIPTLKYLFVFLEAYDFASEGSEDIQEDNKTLVNASVLGLIFEKINGYKDGSFFTPGFITMYMCRETIRRAVVQKFNDVKGWNCTSLDEVYNKDNDSKESNQIINSLKICDPAVGSGHFLVSALNEIISIKSDLRILNDRHGKRLKEYHVEVVNDELIITDEDGELFGYNPMSKESQRVQEALFHEKQTIIENCLFGVDINPNSVKICRLRLWIELLKNAYYKNSKELETLPNIDINIKCGNSLISRFPIDADLKQALKKSKWSIDMYRVAVQTYRNAENKEQKHEMEKLIKTIKTDFRSEIASNSKEIKDLSKLKGELFSLTNQTSLFEKTAKEKKKFNEDTKALTEKVRKQEAFIEEIKNNRIYENAFEWRFEFPEVLNDDGDFIGFDVVIGNPPYIRQEELAEIKIHLSLNYSVFTSTSDIYVYFVELGIHLLRKKGNLIYILPNKWMRAAYGVNLRKFIKAIKLLRLIDFGDLPVFDEASTYPCILTLTNESCIEGEFESVMIDSLGLENGIEQSVKTSALKINKLSLSDSGWALIDPLTSSLLGKIKSGGVTLSEYVQGRIFYGLKTGFNEAFILSKNEKDVIIRANPTSAELIKPVLSGRDMKRYQQPVSETFLIVIPKGYTIKSFNSQTNVSEPPPRYGNMTIDDAWNWFQSQHSKIAEHLLRFKEKAIARTDMGDFWWELRACDYYSEFDKPKIMLPDISNKCEALFDFNKGYYCLNTAYIIPDLTLSDLAILNSKLILFYYSSLTQTIRGGYLRFIKQYLEKIPFPNADESIKNQLVKLVSQIVELRTNDPHSDIFKIDRKIDQIVYELYGLSEEEIGIVEDAFKK